MKKMNILKLLVIIFVLSLVVFIAGCKTPTPEPPKYDVSYINDKLDATGFTSYFYQKIITSGEIILLEENTNVTSQGDKYLVKTEISKLASLEDSKKYDVQETEEVVEIASDPIKLTIQESDFSTVEVTEISLVGKVKDEANILGYSVKDLTLKISLENSKPASIELTYVDAETNLTVKLIVKYSY